MLEKPTVIQAHLNEYKGHLFEYLLAIELARAAKCEREFLESFGGEAKRSLEVYEQWLQMNHRETLFDLIRYSRLVSKHLIEQEIIRPALIESLIVMGKSAQSQKYEQFKECDLLITEQKGRILPLSLKLCGQGAFLHTKSAGVRSFLKKYFSCFKQAELFQEKFNQKVTLSFNQMAYDLYELMDIPWPEGGRPFGPEWTQAALSDRPGALPDSLRNRLHQAYFEMVQPLYSYLEQLYLEDAQRFKECLPPLVGFGLSEMLQINCFEQKERKEIRVETISHHEVLRELSSLRFHPVKQGLSSFLLEFGHFKLQLRLKPMNSFTTPGYKVNCSYKKERS